ncbi:putative N-acetylglucosamine-6-phosphate deacetylase [Oceanicola granulosus HTCC2516]|uniref:Putative N-acetylglucosamine-6-phosphate deacetylase n=1 Tax=Oceanicola granulosus (strain ATCC BAA-861 / DSM 15982 / KCTC 12143 / HTCC2516) TaxID=314256 RepID=Q2CFC4_OCEGH|nr:N-acetylglucosamine-6-phosphate deacetylase [Oceanicola granulosus]EAR51371.1 putative N-acetylglucosamine-6-phosphate deacetylase [Oceanicola granulosus HTCC2516]
MAEWIAPEWLFDGQRLHEGLALQVRDGRVSAIGQARPEARRLAGLLTPGFVDLQVNGGGGCLLNTTPTVAGMETIAAAHRRLGTVAILPTLITDAPEVLEETVSAAISAQGREGIIGLHIEGPHIAAIRRGTHDARFVRPMVERTLELVSALREAGVRVMITVAPEAVSDAQVARLAATGAVVSIGHSDASAEQARAAVAAGARCFTHLFNAMSQMQNREPGVVGAAINSAAHAGIICDGHHVADEMVALAIRARPVPDRMFFVSDAMPTVGGPGSFALYGREIRVENGRLVNAEGSLAGAHVTMAESVARAIKVLKLAPEMALRMAVSVPAELIGRPDLATLEGRALSDIAHLSSDWTFDGYLDSLL